MRDLASVTPPSRLGVEPVALGWCLGVTEPILPL